MEYFNIFLKPETIIIKYNCKYFFMEVGSIKVKLSRAHESTNVALGSVYPLLKRNPSPSLTLLP